MWIVVGIVAFLVLVFLIVLLAVAQDVDTDSVGSPRSDTSPDARPNARHDYRLEWNEYGDGQGYTMVRNDDGQRLQWRTLPKSEGLESIGVAGESYHMEELQSPAFEPGRRLSLVREPDNPHSEDGSATKIMDADEELHVGYIPSEHSTRIAKKLDGGEKLDCYSMWETRKRGERVSLRVLLLEDGASVALP